MFILNREGQGKRARAYEVFICERFDYFQDVSDVQHEIYTALQEIERVRRVVKFWLDLFSL